MGHLDCQEMDAGTFLQEASVVDEGPGLVRVSFPLLGISHLALLGLNPTEWHNNAGTRAGDENSAK